jgi:dihydroceramide fatty acyl 2-hydroxylase
MTPSPTPSPSAGTTALDQPLVAQVRGMSTGYDAWVHRSIRPEGSLRLFRSDALEVMTHVPWWLVPLVWVPVVTGLLLLAVLGLGLPWASALGIALAGFAGWTLLEYGLHRFVFHWQPKGPLGRQLHFLIHGIHHLDPWDATRLVFPPVAGFIVATPIFALLWLAFPLATALAAMAGLLVGYIVYDMTHYHVHHRKCRTRWGKYLKAYHLAHHHKHWNAMFGVSSPLWDVVFRTGKPSERV